MKKFFFALLAFSILVATSIAGPSSSSSSRPSSSSSSSSSSRSYSGGSRPSYSSGSKVTYSGGASKPTPTPSTPSKSYSGGSTPTPSKSYSGGNSQPTKSKTSFDSIAAKEQIKVESRQAFAKGQTAKPEYKTAKGTTASLDPKDARISHLRGQLDHERWVNRDLRQQQFYGAYYSRPMVVFHDPYPSVFWWWMLDRSLEERAMWAYCHRSNMDSARYQAMLSKDAQLEARIRQLEVQGVARNSSYTPKGMDADLMYSNEYVDAVYNPVPVPASSGVSVISMIFLCVVISVVVAFAIWLIFFRKVYR